MLFFAAPDCSSLCGGKGLTASACVLVLFRHVFMCLTAVWSCMPACSILHASYFMLHAVCCMLHASYSTLRASRSVLRTSCSVLHAARFMPRTPYCLQSRHSLMRHPSTELRDHSASSAIRNAWLDTICHAHSSLPRPHPCDPTTSPLRRYEL